jgi:Fe-S oxidoreductase
VILFNDTFTNYNEPAVGRAALRLLEEEIIEKPIYR